MQNDRQQEIPLEQLDLDLQNPRFGLLAAEDQNEALRILYESADLKELWRSIAQVGFERFEPLIAIPGASEGRFIVIEGNRRLAACKTLINPSELGRSAMRALPELGPSQRASIDTLPVVVVRDRAEADAFIGFKHVNGPATWSSIAKARFGVRLLEAEISAVSRKEKMQDLSDKLGDGPSVLLRTFVGYKVYQQAIAEGIADAPVEGDKPIEFSHLYTMLNHPPTRSFLGFSPGPLSADDVRDNPVPPDAVPRLKELWDWLFGEKSVIARQGTDRPRLQKVIATENGLAALRETKDLDYAYKAAGLDAGDWKQRLSAALHNSRLLDEGVFEVVEHLEKGEIEDARKQIEKARRYLFSALQKLDVGADIE
ncbi:ParB N-terminal domain-containing protein [Thalassococcus profundi]|nr:ParB N-terminal domain-containing protein [Thalassococcus profundi]